MDDETPSHSSHDPSPFRERVKTVGEWLDDLTPLLAPIALMATLIAAVYVFQGQARVNLIVDCFSNYTTDRFAAEGERLAASQALDEALTEATRTDVRFSRSIARAFTTGDPRSRARIGLTNAANLDALVEVRDARRHLLNIREEFPLPEPCHTR